jgi:hypothetical protein
MTKPQEAMRQLFRVTRDRTGNLPPLPGIFPDYLAPVIRVDPDGERRHGNDALGFSAAAEPGQSTCY